MSPATVIQLNTFDWIALTSSIASLILAVVSIYLAVHFFIKSKEAEKQASNTLTKIEVQTKTLQNVSTRMLDKYVNYSTQPKQADETVILLAQMVQNSMSQGLSGTGETIDNDKIMQHLTTLYIVVVYYAALTNITMQSAIPEDMNEADLEAEMPWIRTLLDRSNADFKVAAEWLDTHGGTYIQNSTVSNYYGEIVDASTANQVTDTFGTYARRSETP